MAHIRLSVLLLKPEIPVDGIVDHVVEPVVYLGYALFMIGYHPVGFVAVKLQYALHLYLHELKEIVAGDFAQQIGLERFKPAVYMLQYGIHGLALLKLLVLVYALLDKYAFERSEMQCFLYLTPLYQQLAAQQVKRRVHAMAQYIAHSEEMRLFVRYDAAVGRYAHLTVGKCIKRVDGLV